jgi:excisionase family DNA binding protein
MFVGEQMSDKTVDRWLSVDEIPGHLGVKRYTIYKWIERKSMPAHKVGSLWKFNLAEIDDWVRSGAASSDNEAKSHDE